MDNALCIIWCNHAALSCHSTFWWIFFHCVLWNTWLCPFSFSSKSWIIKRAAQQKDISFRFYQSERAGMSLKWPKYDQWIDQKKWMNAVLSSQCPYFCRSNLKYFRRIGDNMSWAICWIIAHEHLSECSAV